MRNVGMRFDPAGQNQSPARVDPFGPTINAFGDGRDAAVLYSDICFECVCRGGYRAIMNNRIKIHLLFLVKMLLRSRS